MLIISHRGNIDGRNLTEENNPQYIMEAIHHGFDVEIDVWYVDGRIFLGHDNPFCRVDYYFLMNKGLWIHCKNLEAITYLYTDNHLNVFYHKEGIAITTKGFLWTAPGDIITKDSIAAMPELVENWDIRNSYGVCTDFPYRYR